MRRYLSPLIGLVIALVSLVVLLPVAAQEHPAPPAPLLGPAPAVTAEAQPQLVPSTKNDVSPSLESIAPIAADAGEGVREIPRLPLPRGGAGAGGLDSVSDTVLQTVAGAAGMPAPLRNFEGVNNRNGVLPPDTEGDVGPNHYVQWVNLSFAIWNKSGTLLYGPANGNTLWSGFGGPCESSNDGDPIALYDSRADRWFMSQFALPSAGSYYQCIAVSTTPSPLGSWYRYAFRMPNNKVNDYPHFGIWPDGYYMSDNQFVNGQSWGGAGVWAFDRTKMLAGLAASGVYFDLGPVNMNYGGMLPSHLTGSIAPPAGAPNYFAEVDDSAWGGFATDRLQIWKFHVDWNNPANSTFTGPVVLNTAPFDGILCGGSRNCIPQPGTSQGLDTLADLLMYRLNYRRFADNHESLVVNHTVDVGSDRAGVRWYEVRSPGSNPVIYQQGTYAPDTANRWMGSVAMDRQGNMALGYSVSSSTVYPSIRYTGRLAGDPLGQMSQGEATLVAGGGSQTHSAGRWGDYSSMSIDPVDDCTFWYTQEYMQATSSASWRTRIGSFKFPNCSATPQGTLQGTVVRAGTTTPIAGAQVSAGGQTTTSGANGAYSMLLPAGSYTVDASASGYQPNSIPGVAITAGQTRTLQIPLTPAPACYTLTRTHGGSGGDPVASPANSAGCPTGQYTAGQSLSLTASPAPFYRVGSWTGTSNNASTLTTNTATMPASNHTVTVNYVAVGGKGFGINVEDTNGSTAGGNVAALTWTGGTAQDQYIAIRFDAISGGLQFLGPLAAAATSHNDTIPADSVLPCYALAPLRSGSMLGLSDILCGVSSFASGTVPDNFTLRLNQSNTASLGWIAPSGVAGYAMYALRLDGSVPQTTFLVPTTTSFQHNTGGLLTCYWLVAFNSSYAMTGATSLLCGVPGESTIDAATAGSLEAAADQVRDRVKQLLPAR